MFGDDIGGMCKVLAKIVLWGGIILSVASGILLMIFLDDLAPRFSAPSNNTMYLGIVVMILGPLLSFITSIPLYALGQVVENTNKLLSIKSAQDAQDSSNQQKGNAKGKAKLRGLSKEFINEIINSDTEDLRLIVQDQRELYTQEEFNFIKKQLSERSQ